MQSAPTHDDVEREIRHGGKKIENENAGDAREISEWNEGELRAERERNVKPCAMNPRLRRIQRPKRAGQRGDDGAADHEKQFSIKVRVFVAENEKEFVRENRGPRDDGEAKGSDASDNGKKKPAEFARALATRKFGDEDVGEQIAHDGEDHGETAERADFGHRADAMRE